MNSVNIRQLAEHLGLSSSTVSRAMHNSHEISQTTRERVRLVAQKLNYQPNPFASSLRNQVTQTIGVVLPEVDNRFFSMAINGIEEVARQNGYHVLIYLTHDSEEKEKSVVQYLTNGRVDGILASLASGTHYITHLEKLKERGIPIVQFDRVSEKLKTATVTTDDLAGGYKGTDHLLRAGCQHVAALQMSDNLSIGRRRLQGYKDALHDHDISFDSRLVFVDDEPTCKTQARLRQFLEQNPQIDGIFASTEHLALSTYHVCRSMGLAIPNDIKVVGYSNMEIASLLAPALTTITQPAYEIGKAAARILFQALTKKKPVLPTQSVELKGEFIVRASTGGGRA